MRLLILAVICLGCQFVDSATYDYSLRSQVDTSENITQQLDGLDGEIYLVGFTFDTDIDLGNDWNIIVDSEFSHVDYSVDELVNEDLVNLLVETRYQPDSSNFAFSWIESIAVVPGNRFQTQLVNNRRDAALSAIRPEYRIRFNAATNLTFAAQYSDYRIDSNATGIPVPDDSRDNTQASISLNHNFSNNRELSLILQDSDTNFDLADGIILRDYQQQDALLRWTQRSETSQVLIELGETIVSEFTGVDVDEELGRLSISRQSNSQLSWRLDYTRGVEALLSVNSVTGDVIAAGQFINLGQAQRIENGQLSVDYRFGSSILRANIFEGELNALFLAGQEIRRGHTVAAEFDMARLFETGFTRRLIATYIYTESDFDIPQIPINETEIKQLSLVYQHQVSRNFNLTFGYENRDADQFQTGTGALPFDSNNLSIGFIYQDQGQW